eukprot:3471985-Prymnesium_polylepis.1
MDGVDPEVRRHRFETDQTRHVGLMSDVQARTVQSECVLGETDCRGQSAIRGLTHVTLTFCVSGSTYG